MAQMPRERKRGRRARNDSGLSAPVIFCCMRKFSIIVGVVSVAALLAGCKKQAAGGPAKMPPPQVIVAEARSERVVETL